MYEHIYTDTYIYISIYIPSHFFLNEKTTAELKMACIYRTTLNT